MWTGTASLCSEVKAFSCFTPPWKYSSQCPQCSSQEEQANRTATEPSKPTRRPNPHSISTSFTPRWSSSQYSLSTISSFLTLHQRVRMPTSGAQVWPGQHWWKAQLSSQLWTCPGYHDNDEDHDVQNEKRWFASWHGSQDEPSLVPQPTCCFQSQMGTLSRMNQACLKIGNSIFVAGGVTTDNFDQRLVTKKVERCSNKSTSSHWNRLESKTTEFSCAGTTSPPTVGSSRRTCPTWSLASSWSTWMAGRPSLAGGDLEPTSIHYIPLLDRHTMMEDETQSFSLAENSIIIENSQHSAGYNQCDWKS